MYIEIKPDSPISIFQQIMDGIRYGVLNGRLVEDEKLPSWRELAVELRVNANTVARAYQELEREGVLYVKRGEGTFVAARKQSIKDKERLLLLKAALQEAIDTGLRLQFSKAEIAQEIKQIIADTDKDREERK